MIFTLFEEHLTCIRDSLNVTLEWYVNFLTKKWCKALKRGSRYLWKNGP